MKLSLTQRFLALTTGFGKWKIGFSSKVTKDIILDMLILRCF